MSLEIYIDGTDRASKLLSTSFSRQNKLGIGSFSVIFEDVAGTLYGLFAQDQTVKIKSNSKYIFYGFITGMTRNDNDTLTVVGTSYKGRFNKTRPIYQFYDTDRKEIAQKLITKAISEEYVGNSVHANNWTFADSNYIIAAQITPDSDYQYIDKIRIWMEHSDYGNDRSDKPFLIAAIYPDNGSDYPDLSAAREALSFVETAIYWDPKSNYPVDIDFKQLVDISTAKKWLVFAITDEINSCVTLKAGTPTATFLTRYSVDGGSSWQVGDWQNPAMTVYGLKRSNIDIQTYFDSDYSIDYSIEHNSVGSSLKELSDCTGKSFFDRLAEGGGLMTYLKLDSNVTDEYGNTSWTPTSISYGTGHSGVANCAAVLNGSNSRITTARNTAGWEWSGEFAICYWVYLTTSTAEDAMVVFGEYNHDGCNAMIDYLGSGKLLFRAQSSGTSGADIYSDSAISTGAWHHIVLQRDAKDEIQMYVDSVKQTDTATVSGTIYPDAPYLYMGRISHALDGRLDDVCIFKGVSLTQAEIDGLHGDTLVHARYNNFYESFLSGEPILCLHWESSTSTVVVGCDVEEGVNLLDNNLHDTEIINLCKVYGKDRNNNEILATYQDGTSIGTYGIKEYVIRRDNINTYEDCYNYAKGVVDNFKDVNVAGHVMISWSTAANYNTDDLFPNLISIKIPSKSIDSSYIAQKITWNFPDHTVRIDFAEDINLFNERMSTLFSDVGGRKQTKNLQASDNTLSIDFTQGRSSVDSFVFTDYDGMVHKDGVGLIGDDTGGYSFILKGIETNQDMLNYMCSMTGDNLDNSYTVFETGTAPVISSPISQTHISTSNHYSDFRQTGDNKIRISVIPRIFYGTDGSTVFTINTRGEAHEIYTDIAITETRWIQSFTAVEGVTDDFKPTVHKGYVVVMHDNTMATYSSDWKKISSDYNLTGNTGFVGKPYGILAIFGAGAGTAARRYIILVACGVGTTGYIAIYWLSEDMTTFTEDNRRIELDWNGWFTSNFGSSTIFDMAKENCESDAYCRFFGVLKETADSKDLILPFNLDYSSSFVDATSWGWNVWNGAIHPPGRGKATADYYIGGIDCFSDKSIAGSSHQLGGTYNLMIADTINEDSHSNIVFNFIDNAYHQMPYRYDYTGTGSVFHAHYSITHGPANCILKGLELKMMANHTIYDLPGYLDIDDYL